MDLQANKSWLTGFTGCLASTLVLTGACAAEPAAPAGEFAIVAREGMAVEPSTASRFSVRLVRPADGVLQSLSQSAIKQSAGPARLGPKADIPHFAVRFALPIPPENDTNKTGVLTGLDAEVYGHNHSPGFQVLPNGDVLAIYFSAETPRGAMESAPSARFVQARLRHGAAEWDLPELFFDSRDYNDQSALLWVDGGTVRFFGGGRENPVPFKMAASTDNGATWTLSLPILDKPPQDYTAQPVVNAFRDPAGAMYFAMDAAEDNSFLWKSLDGVRWEDTGGRTGGRHSTIVPLGDGQTLLSLGGKNTAVNGYTPQNLSRDWGATWSESTAAAFSPLGGNQRPSLIRLANGNLCFVTDSYHRRKESPPEGWTHGAGAFVAISKDEGKTWRIKRLPVELPHEADRARGTLGYASVAQAPSGVIHVLATMTHPCLHYEFNEAWVYSDSGEIVTYDGGGRKERFTEKYANGKERVSWSAQVYPDGRYLLDGKETSWYEDGQKEHEVVYVRGRKSGEETFWAPDGRRLWSWDRDLKKSTGVWTHYWPNGRKRIESHWNLNPKARDLERAFTGLVAHGTATHWNAEGKVVARHQFDNGVLVGGSSRSVAENRAP